MPTILDQSGPGSDSNKVVLCIPQSYSITVDCLVSFLGQSFGEVLLLCKDAGQCILQPQLTGPCKMSEFKYNKKNIPAFQYLSKTQIILKTFIWHVSLRIGIY